MQETSLHAALKNRYTSNGDQQEVEIDGFLVDVVKGNQLIEIQTSHFHQIKPKLLALLETKTLTLVHPIAQEKWIVRLSKQGEMLSRRKSPRRGRPEHIFSELIRFPQLISHPNLTLELLMIQEEVIWRDDGQGSWRRKGWSIADRRLIQVLDSQSLHLPSDYIRYLPLELLNPFTSTELAQQVEIPRRLAQQMIYCFRAMVLIQQVGRRGRAFLYTYAF